ncbi:MAG: hypothetical protein ACRDRN_14875, partial [Sciscionella sp.]
SDPSPLMISNHNRDTSPDHPTTPNHTKSQHNTMIKLGYVALRLTRALSMNWCPPPAMLSSNTPTTRSNPIMDG